MRYLSGDYSYSICVWGLHVGWLAGFMFFNALYALFCLMCILVNLRWHLLIDDMLPMGHCQVLPHLCPLLAVMAMAGRQQEVPCGSLAWINHGTRAGSWWFSRQPSFHTNYSPLPSRPEHLWSNPVGPSWTKKALMRFGLPRSPRGLVWQQASGGWVSR